jgi:hypothetical protein
MDARFAAEMKQHHIDVIAAASDALGQDFNALLSARVVYDQAGLAIKAGGASPQFSTANKIRYGIGGSLYSMDQQAALSFSAALPIIPVASSAAFLVQVSTLGVFTTKAGTVVSGANAPLPVPDLLNAPIGVIWVQTNGSTTFTPGTTKLDMPGLTVEYVSFMCLQTGLGTYPRLPTAPFTSAAALDTNPTPPVFNPQAF